MESKLDEIKISYSTLARVKDKITTSQDVCNYLRKVWDVGSIELFEEFKLILLNNSSNVLGYYNVSKGGITSTIVEIKHIIYIALKTNSSGIILSHNHPSGNLKPSSQDIKFTNRLKEACEIMDLRLVDHLILTKDSYLSMKDEGHL